MAGRHSLCPERLSHGGDEILGLPIQTREVKPVGTMKILSRPFVFAVLAIIAIGAAVSFRAFAAGSQKQTVGPKKFNLRIGRTATEYVDLTKPQADFDTALCRLKKNGGDHDITFLPNAGGTPIHPYVPNCPVSIKTDKVTTSEIAKRGPTGESANDPNVVTHLSADSATDIKSVLDTFQ